MLSSPVLLPEGGKQKGKIDIAGALLATTALILLVYAIVTGGQAGWLSFRTIGLLALSVALFIAFVRVQKKSANPLVSFAVFKRFNLTPANIVMAFLAATWIPLWFYLNLYLQQTLGLSAFRSGLALLPMTAAIMILMVGVTGKLIQKFGFKKNLVAGLALLTFSLSWFANAPVDGSFMSSVLGPSLLAALGMSLAYIPGTMAAMMGARLEETGLASGLVNTSYQFGSAIGLAIVVALAAFRTNSLAAEGTDAVVANNEGFRAAFLVAAVLGALATFLAAGFVKTPKEV